MVEKMNTVSLGACGRLKLVVSTQSFSKVGHLAAHEQVILVHDLFFSQAVILKGGEATFVRTYTIVLAGLRKQADMFVCLFFCV